MGYLYLTVAVFILAIGGYYLYRFLSKRFEETRVKRQRFATRGATLSAELDRVFTNTVPHFNNCGHCVEYRIKRRGWALTNRLELLIIITPVRADEEEARAIVEELASRYDRKIDRWMYPTTFHIVITGG